MSGEARRSGEAARHKARRYLLEGRVVVDEAGAGHIRATVRGDGVLHHVSCDDDGWHCTCPRTQPGSCSHVLALMLVSAPYRPRPSP